MDTADLINPDDFKSIQIKIAVKNLDSGVELRDGKKILPDKGKKKRAQEHPPEIAEAKLVEFVADQGMVLEVPANFCTKDQRLLVSIEVLNAKSAISFELEAEVKKIERFEQLTYVGDGDRVEHEQGAVDTLTLVSTRYDEQAWAQLKAVYVARQGEIEEFFATVKDG